MNHFNIVTIGGAVRDITFYTKEGRIFSTPENLTAQKMLAFEWGGKINIKEAYFNSGGGAANTAVCLARLNLKTAIIAAVGKDEMGKEVLANLKKEKVDTGLIQLDQRNQTGFSVILTTEKKEKEHIVFSYRGAANFLDFDQRNNNKLNSDWFYITSLAGLGWQRNLKSIFKLAKQKKIKIVWNPGSRQLREGKRVLNDFLKQTDILILNKDEAIELVLSGVKLGKKNPNYLNRPLYLLNILQEWGPKIIVITEGNKGAWAYNGQKIYRQKALKPKVIDTTGVGDAFGASFLAGLISENNNIQKALRWGIINSASVITKIGAHNGLLNLKELKKRLQK
ncbi:MAG: carbohydrate kinase family protein [Patescibacteria group bacterium]|jgi:sugar/nucleoside kinase (ribokinase family)